MKLSTNTEPKKEIEFNQELIAKNAEEYTNLKEQKAIIKAQLKPLEEYLKNEKNEYSEIETATKILTITINKVADKFDLNKFKEDHPKLKWNDTIYFIKQAPIKKILLKKLG